MSSASATPLRVGADLAEAAGFRDLDGQRVAVLCNPTSLIRRAGAARRRVHLVDALRAAGVQVTRLFGPEHGLWATAQDMVGVDGGVDPVFGLPVATLYGHDAGSLVLRPDALAGIDVLVFDIADVGARYYTYAATLVMALDACARAGVRVVVFDRPNPLGGERVEGNAVQLPRYRSFVGWIDIPQRHALTVGEIARLAAAEAGLSLQLDIVACEGWDVGGLLDEQETGALGPLWTPPSPNMPTLATALVYPGMCLIEATTLSEGRGTTRPFEVVGAPGVPARALAAALLDRMGDFVDVRPLRFEPAFQKHARQVCDGVAIEVIDRHAIPTLALGLHVLAAARAVAPAAWGWRPEAYEFVDDVPAIDLLMGGPEARLALEAGAAVEAIVAPYEEDIARFAARARPHLLYPRRRGPLAAA